MSSKHPLRHHKNSFWTPARRRSMYMGALLLILSVIIQVAVGRYSAGRALDAAPAKDLFLSNLPLVDLGSVIVAGAIMLWCAAWVLMMYQPKYLIFGTKAIALFIVSRAFFINLTQVGPYPITVPPGPANSGFWLYHLFTFQGNFFYSGHTAFPFLLMLIFWDRTLLRRLFFALTIFFGGTMLLAHQHYSIDVFAAPFIVYGVFVVTAKLFPEDYALLPHARSRAVVAQ